MNEGFDRWLRAVQQMEPIVSTAAARDLRDVPEAVRARYEKHVALYVALARVAATDDAASVPALERRLIDLVKRGQAPRGYVAAHYGHGKTSAGLFLWKRCEEAGIVAVPPFKLTDLQDIVAATHGWVRHVLGRSRPGLVGDADEIAGRAISNDLESFARRHDIPLAKAQQMLDEGSLALTLDGLQYVRFLAEMVDLVKQAGFAGLVVVADEIQQYLGEAKQHGWDEQLRRWFDLTEAMRSRRGELACGIIYLIRTDELAAVNGDRADLVQRLQESRVHLDLAEVYGDDFPGAFCRSVAGDEGYRSVVSRVVDEHALRALGQIATRADLAAGPRTVVDVLQIAARRFEAGGPSALTPADLVRVFEQGQVTFDGLEKIQGAVRESLAHPVVAGNEALEQAVRLAAAFPTTGVTRATAQAYQLEVPLAELERLTAGDLVAVHGGGYDRQGRPVPEGVVLIGLAPPQVVVTWLKGHVRRFRTQYFLTSDRVREDAERGFEALLFRSLLPAPQWRVDREYERTALSQNRAFLLRGSFTALQTRYPDRTVYARILMGDEAVRDAVPPEADLILDLVLGAGSEMTEDAAARPGAIEWLSDREARLRLNLLHHTPGTLYHNLNPGFEDLVSPHDVTPLLLLSLYESLRRADEAGRIPNTERSLVVSVFMPELLKTALAELASAELGRDLGAAQSRIVEEVVRRLCEAAFPDYQTLMTVTTWQQSLREYQQGLMSRDDPLERRGEAPIVGTKEQVARLFGRQSATFDAFRQNFGHFFKVDEEWRGRESIGKVRLTLHPLERRICGEVERLGGRIPFRNPATKQIEEVPQLEYAEICRSARALGYRQREVDVALELLESRQLVQWLRDEGKVLRVEPPVPERDELLRRFQDYRARLERLVSALDRPAAIQAQLTTVSGWIKRLGSGERTSGVELVNAERTLATLERQLDDVLRSIRDEVAVGARQLAEESESFDRPIAPIDQRTVETSELFGRQLEFARADLSGRQRTLLDQARRLREAVGVVCERVQREGGPDDELAESGRLVRQLAGEVRKQRSAREQLRGQLHAYDEARQILRDGVDLRQRAGRAGLAEPLERIAAWSGEIEAKIAGGRTGALAEAPTWRTKLETIAQSVVQREREAQDRFIALQERLLAVIARDLRGEGRFEWRSIAFNATDPEASMQDLRDRFAAAIEQIAGRLDEQMRDVQSNVLAIEQGRELQLAAPEVRATILDATRQIHGQSDLARQGLSDWLALGGPIRQGEDLEQAAERIAASAPSVLAAVTDAVRRYQQVRRTILDRISLSEEEAGAYAALRERAAAGSTDGWLEWDAVRAALGDPAEAGRLLARLAEKHRLRIRVQIIE